MKDRFLLISIVLFILGGVEAAEEVGNYRIPDDILVDGKIVQQGMYKIRTEENSGDSYLELVKGEKVIAKEPAIMLPARGSGKTSIVSVRTGARDFVRIRARGGDKWFLVYFNIQHSALSTQH